MKIWLYIWAIKNMYGFTKVSTKLLYAQTYHETGNYSSPVFKENKNLFGMRHPSKRKTYSQGSNLGHAVFKNHFNSVRDYFERQKEFNISNTNDTAYVLETVASNYATDPNYSTKWEAIANKIKMPFTNGVMIALFFFLIFSGVMIFKAIKQNKK
ncbi:hypothetical protein A9Q86_02200 [Flavobacteriales bacterium 33_180_T64]|nr:hypothetical protein A9Q86_02200 [Flavobacteriales bacterium 33_180_T64]